MFVADIQAACDFYTGKLGFTVAFTYGDPPFYAQLARDHALLNLRVVGEPVFAGDIREREGLLSATLTLATADEIKQLFSAYQAAASPLPPAPQKRALGSPNLRHSGPGRKLHSLCRPRRLTRPD